MYGYLRQYWTRLYAVYRLNMPMTIMHRSPGKKPRTFRAAGNDNIPIQHIRVASTKSLLEPTNAHFVRDEDDDSLCCGELLLSRRLRIVRSFTRILNVGHVADMSIAVGM